MGGDLHVRHAKRGGELTQVVQQSGSLIGWNSLCKRPASDRGLWVQLKATPIDINLKLIVQPDQAASLGNEAERSDKV